MDPLIKEFSPSLLPTGRAGEGARDVTARDTNSLFIKDIPYVFLIIKIKLLLKH